MPHYIYLPAHELARLIREGTARSVDIVQEHLNLVRQRNGELNAFISVFEDEALAVAAERDEQARTGTYLGPLHGVPISIKEQFWIKGKRSTTNAKLHKDFVAAEDAVVVDRVRASGAVILGQTTSRDSSWTIRFGATSTLKERTPTTRTARLAEALEEAQRQSRQVSRPLNWGAILEDRPVRLRTSAVCMD